MSVASIYKTIPVFEVRLYSSSVVYFIHSSTSLDVTTCRYKWWKWAFSKGCLAFGYRVRSSAK